MCAHVGPMPVSEAVYVSRRRCLEACVYISVCSCVIVFKFMRLRVFALTLGVALKQLTIAAEKFAEAPN